MAARPEAKTDHEKKLAWCRATLTTLNKKLKVPEYEPSETDLYDIKRILNALSKCSKRSEPFLKTWQLSKALRLILAHSQKLPDALPPLIEMQIAAWDRGEYNLAASSEGESDDENEMSSSEEEQDAPPVHGSAMKGIIRERSKSGKMWVYKIDKAYWRPASRFGTNGLEVGAWWPLQICAIRNGAHGARMGGIYGRKETGAYSVIVSGGSGYDDHDMGDVVWYSGSGGKGLDQVLGTGNQALITSFNTKNPVRLLRGSKSGSAFAPSQGLRYDGLYVVTNHTEGTGKDGFKVYRYKLERLPGQKPIQTMIPGRKELITQGN